MTQERRRGRGKGIAKGKGGRHEVRKKNKKENAVKDEEREGERESGGSRMTVWRRRAEETARQARRVCACVCANDGLAEV